MREKNGKLIALCGIDASGKTTQARLLRERAEEEGLKVEHVSFPRYGESFFADLVQRYLRGEFGEEPGQISPYLAALPYACDRWQTRDQLRRWLAAGRLVVCNRYVPANLAHQGSKLRDQAERRRFFDWEAELEYEVFELPRPDLQILLDMPPEAAVRLRKGRDLKRGIEQQGLDIHEADFEYLRATSQTYRQVAAETPGPWTIIPCAENGAIREPERIAEDVWSEVRRALYNEE